MTWESEQQTVATTAEVIVKGDTVTVEEGTSFGTKVMEIARDYGVKKFDVELNGVDVDASDAPESFEAGDKVVIKPTKALG